MSRISALFEGRTSPVLSVYFTAGFPRLNDTVDIISLLQQSGVELIEIGIPFSDPVADGPVIQASSIKALRNGMNLRLLFDQLRGIRASGITIPLVLMGYLNPVVRFGIEPFLKEAAACGIDAVILPDLPLEEYEREYKELFAQYGISMVFLITPQTSEERVRRIDAASGAFIYMVTSSATTGAQSGFSEEQKTYFARIRDLNLKHPVVAGFGIHNRENFTTTGSYVQGGIVGSAFIKAVSAPEADLKKVIPEFIQQFIS